MSLILLLWSKIWIKKCIKDKKYGQNFSVRHIRNNSLFILYNVIRSPDKNLHFKIYDHTRDVIFHFYHIHLYLNHQPPLNSDI